MDVDLAATASAGQTGGVLPASINEHVAEATEEASWLRTVATVLAILAVLGGAGYLIYRGRGGSPGDDETNNGGSTKNGGGTKNGGTTKNGGPRKNEGGQGEKNDDEGGN
jgi:hypothetical protein